MAFLYPEEVPCVLGFGRKYKVYLSNLYLLEKITPWLRWQAKIVPQPDQLLEFDQHQVDFRIHSPSDLYDIVAVPGVFQALICVDQHMGGKCVSYILSSIVHPEELKFLQALALCQIPVVDVMPHLMAGYHLGQVSIHPVIEQHNPLLPTERIHPQ